MTSINSFQAFNARLREFIRVSQERLPRIFRAPREHEGQPLETATPTCCRRPVGRTLLRFLCRQDAGSTLGFMDSEAEFNQLALALFALQFAHVEPYRRFRSGERRVGEEGRSRGAADH